MTFTLSEAKAHEVISNYPGKKMERIKIQKVTYKGVTFTVTEDVSLLVGDCTVTVSKEAESSDGAEGSVSASATEKNCRKVARKANRKLKKLLTELRHSAINS